MTGVLTSSSKKSTTSSIPRPSLLDASKQQSMSSLSATSFALCVSWWAAKSNCKQEIQTFIRIFLINICPYLIADQHCRNVSERINGGDLFYLSLPAVYAVEGFVIGDVIDEYGSMSTSEVTLNIVITYQPAVNLTLRIVVI